MSTQTKSSSRPWLVFIGCCVLSLVGFGLIVNTPGLYFTVLGETLNVSRTQIALASSIMAIAGAVTMLFAGKVMKMLDSRILISVCIAGVAALFLAQSFFNAVWQFYISFALMGILYVIPISLAPSVLLANWFESKLGMVMGIALGLSGIGGTIFNPVVSWFIPNLGWQTSYRLTALILVICILPFSLLVFKFRPDEAKGEQAYGHIVSAAVADDAQAAGELPGIESKKAYRTPTFVLLVLVSVLLQIVAFARNVGGDFDARGQAHTSNLTQSRVRLLRGGGVNTGAHAATQRAALQGQSLGLLRLCLTSLTDELFNSRQLEFSDSVVSLAFV